MRQDQPTWLDRTIWFFGAAFILSIPLHPKFGFVSLLLLGLAAIARAIRLRTWTPPPWPIYLLILLFVVRVVWTLVSDDPGTAVKFLEAEGTLAAIPAVFFFVDVTEGVKRKAIWMYLFMASAVIAFAFFRLYQSISHSEEPTWMAFLISYFKDMPSNGTKYMLNWRFAHYNFISAMCIYGLVIGWVTFTRAGERLLLVAFGFITLAFIFFTWSLSGAILLVVGVLLLPTSLLLLRLSKRAQIYVTVGGGLAAIVLMVYVYRSGAYARIDEQRDKMVTIAVDAISRKPLFGYGTGSGAEVMHNEWFEYNYSYSVNHPHNQYLTELIQFGLVGSLPLFAFVVSSTWLSLRQRNRALFAVLIIGFLLMLVESPLNSNKGSVPYLFVVCLLACGVNRKN